jgi:hypothetical protein
MLKRSIQNAGATSVQIDTFVANQSTNWSQSVVVSKWLNAEARMPPTVKLRK